MMNTLLGNIVTLLFYLDFPYSCLSSNSVTYEPTLISFKLPLWTWDCVNEKCVPYRASEPGKIQTLETCNMLCSTIQLWPQPTGPVSLATTAVPVRADMFYLKTVEAPSRVVRKHLRDVFELFQQDLHSMQDNIRGFDEWRSVLVHIYVNESGDPRMRIDTDESYKLLIRPKKSALNLIVNVTARSFCGARHALETLSQLVWLDRSAGTMLILQAASVKDAPKFRYRGLLIDTARTYLPLNALLRTIDAMAFSKLNTFHWHISDSQAFSLQLSSIPQLTSYGAYSQGDVYTADQVRAMARRARLRGIRIIIEIDTPAHVGRAWDWGPTLGIGDLVHCIDSEPWPDYCTAPPCGQLNPTNPHVFEALQRIYTEIIQLTGVDDIFHLGGSEISDKCWLKHFKDSKPTELWVNFTKSALHSLESISGRLPNLTLLWTSRISERLKMDFKEFIPYLGLQTRYSAKAKMYVSGIRTVLSNEDSWDLNNGLGDWFEEYNGSPYNSWQRVYEHRPWVRKNIGIIEGGEVTMWSSSLTVRELDSRIWPRAAALGERLWTDRPEGATRPVFARLDVHRSRLVRRGVQAAPIWSNWCTQNTYTCN